MRMEIPKPERLVHNVQGFRHTRTEVDATMTQTAAQQNPLEALVMAELLEIRRREGVLETQLATLNSPRQSLEAGLFELEVAQLERHADRLGRMIDAMSSLFPSGQMEITA